MDYRIEKIRNYPPFGHKIRTVVQNVVYVCYTSVSRCYFAKCLTDGFLDFLIDPVVRENNYGTTRKELANWRQNWRSTGDIHLKGERKL